MSDIKFKSLKHRISILFILMFAITTLVLTSCDIFPDKSKSIESTQSISKIASVTPTSNITVSPTIIEYPSATPIPTIQEPREIIEITTPAVNSEGLIFEPLSIKKRYLIDLNSDGIKEEVAIVPDDIQTNYCIKYNLVINGSETSLLTDVDDWSQSWIVLTDLDNNDKYLDLLHLGGAFSWFCTDFFYYNGEKTVYRGPIWDCFIEYIDYDEEDPEHFYDHKRPKSLLPKKIDGHGKLSQNVPGSVLSDDWSYKRTWMIDDDGMLNFLPEAEYIPIQHEPLKLKMDLPLYSDTSSEATSMVAKKGGSVTLIMTDNNKWMQVRTQNGELGWFQLKDNYNVIIGSKQYFSPDVFEGIYISEE